MKSYSFGRFGDNPAIRRKIRKLLDQDYYGGIAWVPGRYCGDIVITIPGMIHSDFEDIIGAGKCEEIKDEIDEPERDQCVRIKALEDKVKEAEDRLRDLTVDLRDSDHLVEPYPNSKDSVIKDSRGHKLMPGASVVKTRGEVKIGVLLGLRYLDRLVIYVPGAFGEYGHDLWTASPNDVTWIRDLKF